MNEDFYLGGLEKRIFDIKLMFGRPRNIPRGTDEEMAEYFAIENAHTNLLSYQY